MIILNKTEKSKKTVKKKLEKNVNKSLKTKPTSAQETIPYKRVYTNGIIEVENGVFSRSYPLKDIDFSTASDEDEERIFIGFTDFLNALNPTQPLQINIFNKPMDKQKFRTELLMEGKNDDYNHYRDEYNKMLEHQMNEGQNGLETTKSFTVTVKAQDIMEATKKFAQVSSMIDSNISNIIEDSTNPYSLTERLSTLYDIFHTDTPELRLSSKAKIKNKKGKLIESNKFDIETMLKRGRTTKDVISPESFDFEKDYFRIGKSYCRAFYLHEIPSYMTTKFIQDIQLLPYNMLISLFIEPSRQDKSLKMIRNSHLGIRQKIAAAQKKALDSGYMPELISPDLTEAEEEAEKLRKKLNTENQKLFYVTMSFVLITDSMDELEKYSASLIDTASETLYEIRVARNQQEHGFVSSLPLGLCKIQTDHMLHTDSTGTFIPYNTRNYKQKGGRYYGINQINHSMIILNRLLNNNYNGCVFGGSGSGKSFACKEEITSVRLGTNDSIIIIDPKKEYTFIAEKLGGIVVKISPGSGIYINPFDLDIRSAGDENPVTLKIDFICSLYETMSNLGRQTNPIERTIISRCVQKLYNPYLKYLSNTGKTIDIEKAPVFADLYKLLLSQDEPEARNIALIIEPYAVGSFDSFQKHTNVDINNKFLVYDVSKIGSGMKALGLQIAFNDSWNKVLYNSTKGLYTWQYIDEAHRFVSTENAAAMLKTAWKEGRQFGAVNTAITQDPEDFINNEIGRTMVNNSDFVMMLKQSMISRRQLTALFGLSPTQQKYITNNPKGSGLIYTGKTIVPFKNEFPKDLDLYTLMSTDPKDFEKQQKILLQK